MANASPISELRRILTNFDLPVPHLISAPQGGATAISLWVKGHGQIELKRFGDTAAAHLLAEDIPSVTAAHIITGSVLFANADHVAHEAVRAALTAVGTRLVTDVPKSSFAYQDLLLRTGALYVARHVGLEGHNVNDVIEHLASLYNAAAAPVVDRIREELDPAFCRAADALARCPVSKVTRGVITHYMALDVDPNTRQSVAGLRLRAAAAYPALAGFFAMSPAIADAIDASEKLFPVVERQTDGLFTKSVMNRLGQGNASTTERCCMNHILRIRNCSGPRSGKH